MDTASLVQQLCREKPLLAAALRTLTTDPVCRGAVNDLLAVLLEQQALINHKRKRAADSMCPRVGLFGVEGFMSLNHCPDVLLRILCDIAEVPHVTNATTEWLDMMEARNAQRS